MNADTLDSVLAAFFTTLRVTIRTEFTSIWLPIQLGLIVLAALAAVGVGTLVRRRFDLMAATDGWPGYPRLAARALIENFGVLVFIAIVGVMRSGVEAGATHPRTYLLHVAVNLATAWVVIALFASLIRNPFVNRVVAITAWTIAALSILNLLDLAVGALDARGIMLGGLRVTPLLLLKTAALTLIALWAASAFNNVIVRRIYNAPELTPSIRTLMGTLVRITVMTVAVVIVLSMVGIDLSALAWFTGAVGVGIGFGLQKIVSNLVSGIILLSDKSIKPGDVVSIGEHFGWVTNMGARYTSVDTRDGREILIPNEDFVTQRVVNWSYSNDLMRVDVKFAATYGNDPRKVQTAAVAAALGAPQVLKQPAPLCHVSAFGTVAVEYVLWFWIRNPASDPLMVRSAVLLSLWDALEREGVTLPKPGPTRVILEQAS